MRVDFESEVQFKSVKGLERVEAKSGIRVLLQIRINGSSEDRNLSRRLEER